MRRAAAALAALALGGCACAGFYTPAIEIHVEDGDGAPLSAEVTCTFVDVADPVHMRGTGPVQCGGAGGRYDVRVDVAGATVERSVFVHDSGGPCMTPETVSLLVVMADATP
jgi:hypothetical protein